MDKGFADGLHTLHTSFFNKNRERDIGGVGVCAAVQEGSASRYASVQVCKRRPWRPTKRSQRKVKITVKSNVADLLADIHDLSDAVKDKATVRTLNDIAAQVRTRASREIRAAGYNLKAARIKKSLRVRKASSGSLHAAVEATGTVIPLIEFDAREVRAGVSVSVKGGRKIVKGAFIATTPSGHMGVFERRPVGTHRVVVKNGKKVREQLPIKELYGPSVTDAFGNKAVLEALDAIVAEKFETILWRNVNYYRGKA